MKTLFISIIICCATYHCRAQVISGRLDDVTVENQTKISLKIRPSTYDINELVSYLIQNSNYTQKLNQDSIWHCVAKFSGPTIANQIERTFNQNNTIFLSIDKAKKCMHMIVVENSSKDLTLKKVNDVTMDTFSAIKLKISTK